MPISLGKLNLKLKNLSLSESAPVQEDNVSVIPKKFNLTIKKPQQLQFTGTLFPFQNKFIDWVNPTDYIKDDRLILDAEMGLGKSAMLIAHCCRRQYRKIVIVMPLGITEQFMNEWFKFTNIAKDKVVIYHGENRKSINLYNKTVIITNYHSILIDINNESTPLYMIKKDIDMVAIDEAHNISNDKAKIYSACQSLVSNCQNIWLMTGTLIKNKYKDFTNLVKFLRLDNVLLTNGLDDFKQKYYYHMTKASVNLVIPRQTMNHALDLTIEHQCYYDEVFAELREYYDKYTKSEIKEQFSVILTKILRLRQVCNHPNANLSESLQQSSQNLYKGTEIPVKFLTIKEQLDNFPNDKVLIFSQWTYSMELLSDYLKSVGYSSFMYTGDVSSSQRNAIKTQFEQSTDTRIMIININAGGVGLNLTCANHVFILDSWWNDALEEQAINRVYRIGQTKIVYVHKLYINNSIETWVKELKTEKNIVSSEFTNNNTPYSINRAKLEPILNEFLGL